MFICYCASAAILSPSHAGGKITLYRFQRNPAATSVNISPFVSKLEAYLRFAGIPYEYGDFMSKMGGNEKIKLPFIEYGENT